MHRPAPPLTERTAEYWKSGADGVLRIARCGSCGTYLHPPRPVCPQCHSADLAFAPVSGKGTVYSFTVNRYQWTPELEPPYVLAEVELAEQPGLRLLSTVVGCAVEAVRIGMPVSVAFESAGDAWIPVFRP
ncbi:Zn-ribbon domain-containing OB-fold protein [Streptodolium elevatio]|uniref:OB-fold domain-containing protein n=1 Tax=Streptodolium elevatio TaxID=3157996 RepID=A0ABV3DTT4_9ACTN